MGRPDVHPGAHLMTNIYIGSVDEDADGGPVVHLRSRGVFPGGPVGSEDPDHGVLRPLRRRGRPHSVRVADPPSSLPVRFVARRDPSVLRIMATSPKHINHELSAMACPVDGDSVDLFGDGAQEHWYEAYEILHHEAPVLRIEGGGLTPGTDAFVLTKHADVSHVVKDPERFPSLTQARVGGYAEQGLSAEETYAKNHNLMQAAMVSLRPTHQLYTRHRKELTDPWVGPGALRHRDMITGHANALVDEWISDGEVEFISRFARPLPQRVMASPARLPPRGHPAARLMGRCRRHAVRSRHRAQARAHPGAERGHARIPARSSGCATIDEGAFVHRGGDADALAHSRALDARHLPGRGLPGRRGARGLAAAPAVRRGQRGRGGVPPTRSISTSNGSIPFRRPPAFRRPRWSSRRTTSPSWSCTTTSGSGRARSRSGGGPWTSQLAISERRWRRRHPMASLRRERDIDPAGRRPCPMWRTGDRHRRTAQR